MVSRGGVLGAAGSRNRKRERRVVRGALRALALKSL